MDVGITVPASVAVVAGVEEEVIERSLKSTPRSEALLDPVELRRKARISTNTL